MHRQTWWLYRRAGVDPPEIGEPMRPYDPIQIARQFLFVREAKNLGQNRGLRVEAIQHYSGGGVADSWCMEFLWLVFDIAYQGQAPFGRMQACNDLLLLAKQQQWTVLTPAVGDIALSIMPDTGRAHHVALLTGINPLVAIAGNTSEDGLSGDGDRVAEHVISPNLKVFVRVPT